MNGWSNTWSNIGSSPPQPPREAPRPYEYSARPRWRVLEIAAIVVGFMVWWVVGLSLLLWKLWRNRQGYSTDMITAARTSFQENVMTRWPDLARSFSRGANRAPAPRDWGFASFRSSGNSAFDGWREGELARLEEERRKLEAAEREFADYIESLRQAKDREEFERFMRERNAARDERPNA